MKKLSNFIENYLYHPNMNHRQVYSLGLLDAFSINETFNHITNRSDSLTDLVLILGITGFTHYFNTKDARNNPPDAKLNFSSQKHL